MTTTKFLGVTLKGPIIAGSSSLTSNFESIKSFADAGVGGVVLKSVFEEQISNEVDTMLTSSDSPDMYDYLSAYVKENDLAKTISLIKECKEKLDIAIIASVNCKSKGEWINFCKKMEDAGADAIELNIFLMPTSKNQSSQEIEKNYLEIAAKVVEKVKIPVIVKLTNRFTNHIYIINELYKRGVKGITMFNRFWEPDFDTETFTIKGQSTLSEKCEMRSNLRLMGQATKEVSMIEFSASTAIHTTKDCIKMILAGAATVQLCSLLYKDGADSIAKINCELKEWMKNHNFNSISDFKGKMSSSGFSDSGDYERCQFMKQFGGMK